MKLNNQQVSALADKIYKEITNKIDEDNISIKELSNFEVWKKKHKDIVTALESSIYWCDKYYKILNKTCSWHIKNVAELDIDEELKDLFEKDIKLIEYPYRENIKQDIILETIECENLDSIITKLVDKYTK